MMPEDWDTETITYAFKPIWSHGSGATAFGVVWNLRALARGNDDAIPTDFGTAQSSTDTGGTADDLYIGPESADVTASGSPVPGDMVFFEISRDPSEGADTLDIDARLHGLIIYQTAAENPPDFIVATGGVITTDGDYKVHTFETSGTFTVTDGSGNVELLIVGGGGAGGWCSLSSAGGGGGGGGVREIPAYAVVPGAYTVTVGAGGVTNSGTNPPSGDGGDSSFDGETAVGGGHGGSTHSVSFPTGEDGAGGGSGGGGSAGGHSGGLGTSGQGEAGGGGSTGGSTATRASGGGGGGAGGLGDSSPNVWNGGDGGDGIESDITGTGVFYGGGGGGGRGNPSESSIPPNAVGMGGSGGGGDGGNDVNLDPNDQPTAGTDGLGGGGGGGGSNGFTGSTGAAGGSGVVIVRYKFQ